MSTTSSSSPGSNETSNSSSQDLDVDLENTLPPILPLSSAKPLQTVSSQRDGRSIQKIPSKAESVYVWFLNRSRWGERLLPDPSIDASIDEDVPTKWAVLSVLSIKCPLSIRVIQTLLAELSYPRDRHVVRQALLRCEKFGLATRERFHKNEHGILVGRKAHYHHKWRMTIRGQQLLNAPSINMTKETTTNLLEGVLRSATQWMSVLSLAAAVNKRPSTVRRRLRADPTIFKSEKIPGDSHRGNQWALASIDTSGWPNAAPTPSFSGHLVGTCTGRTSSAQPTISNTPRSDSSATYQGMILMCSPTDKPSLVKAVGDLLVNEFVTSGKKFSAHDITKRLRGIELDRAKNATRNMPLPMPNSTPIDRLETGEVHVLGYKVPKIDHEDVRNIVHDIYTAGGMPNLGRVRTNGFWEYDSLGNISALVVSPTDPVRVIVVPDDNQGNDASDSSNDVFV